MVRSTPLRATAAVLGSPLRGVEGCGGARSNSACWSTGLAQEARPGTPPACDDDSDRATPGAS